MEGVEWAKALGLEQMVANLRRAGWTGADIKEYVAKSKRENLGGLDDFAGGGLKKLKGSTLYPVLLEATALRYAMHITSAEALTRLAPPECPHGFRMTRCNACLRGAA